MRSRSLADAAEQAAPRLQHKADCFSELCTGSPPALNWLFQRETPAAPRLSRPDSIGLPEIRVHSDHSLRVPGWAGQ